MVAELAGMLNSLKIANDFAKGFNSLKTEVALNDAKVELTNIILDLQSRTFSLQQQYEEIVGSKRELEKKLTDLSNFNREKEKYVLKQIASGCIAYVSKEEIDRVGDSHWLCQNCLDNQNSFSIYQFRERTPKGNIFYCPNCKSEVIIPFSHKF